MWIQCLFSTQFKRRFDGILSPGSECAHRCTQSAKKKAYFASITAFRSLFYIKQMIPFFDLKVIPTSVENLLLHVAGGGVISSSLQWAWMCAWHSNLQNINIQTTFELQHELYIVKNCLDWTFQHVHSLQKHTERHFSLWLAQCCPLTLLTTQVLYGKSFYHVTPLSVSTLADLLVKIIGAAIYSGGYCHHYQRQ